MGRRVRVEVPSQLRPSPNPLPVGEGFIDMNWEAFFTSLKLATATSLILMLIGLPLSYWVAFSKWRGKFLVEAVVALPLVLPPTVLGFYVLIALGPRSPLG